MMQRASTSGSSARLAERVDDDREEVGRRREVEGARHVLTCALVELRERLAQTAVAGHVVEGELDIAELLEQAVEHAWIRRRAAEGADRLTRDVAVLVVAHRAARDADQVEALRQRAFVREVVDRREQLASREVAGSAEDHEVRRAHGQALEPMGERVVELFVLGLRCHLADHEPLFLTAWPPNWLRSAASTRAA
jgi:hypothetical protein